MPNKRSKNRKRIIITLDDNRKSEINNYLARQRNIKESVQLAILLAEKSFGNADLIQAYQDYTLGLESKPLIDMQSQSQKSRSHSKKKDESLIKSKKTRHKNDNLTYSDQFKVSPKQKDNLKAEDINKMFWNGDSNLL